MSQHRSAGRVGAGSCSGTRFMALLAAGLYSLRVIVASMIIDDAQTDVIDYAGGIWDQLKGQDGPHNGTIHYSNDPTAWYTFNFTGTAFALYASKKNDRGQFLVDVDAVFAGTGDAYDSTTSVDTVEPARLFAVDNLAAAQHTVIVWNSKRVTPDRCKGSQCFLALDYVNVTDAEATTTLSYETASAEYPSSAEESQTGAGDSSGSAVPVIIGGAVGGGIALALFLAAGIVLWLLWRKRRGPFKTLPLSDSKRSLSDGDEESGSGPGMQQPLRHPYASLSSSSGDSPAATPAALHAEQQDPLGRHQQQQEQQQQQMTDGDQHQDWHNNQLPPAYYYASAAAAPTSRDSANVHFSAVRVNSSAISAYTNNDAPAPISGDSSTHTEAPTPTNTSTINTNTDTNTRIAANTTSGSSSLHSASPLPPIPDLPSSTKNSSLHSEDARLSRRLSDSAVPTSYVQGTIDPQRRFKGSFLPVL